MLFLILLFMGGFIFGINVLPVTKNFKVTYAVKLVDKQQRPLTAIAVLNWNYGYEPILKATNGNGEVKFMQDVQWTTSLFLSKWKWAAPDLYQFRIYFPEYNRHYFRLESSKTILRHYHVFNNTYDYFFNENWIGKFTCDSSSTQEIDSDLRLRVFDYQWQKTSKNEIRISFVLQPEFIH